MDAHSVVDDIRSTLEAGIPVSDAALNRMAAAYQVACEAANERLRRCARLLHQGLRSEAIRLGESEPNLIHSVAALDFAELSWWLEWLDREGIPKPPSLLLESAAELNDAYALERPLKAILRQHRLLAVARGPIEGRLHILRELVRCDPGNPAWVEDVLAFERVYLQQIEQELTAAAQRRDTAGIKSLYEELTTAPWRCSVPESLLQQAWRLVQSFPDDAALAHLRAPTGRTAPVAEAAPRQRTTPPVPPRRHATVMESADPGKLDDATPHPFTSPSSDRQEHQSIPTRRPWALAGLFSGVVLAISCLLALGLFWDGLSDTLFDPNSSTSSPPVEEPLASLDEYLTNPQLVDPYDSSPPADLPGTAGDAMTGSTQDPTEAKQPAKEEQPTSAQPPGETSASGKRQAEKEPPAQPPVDPFSTGSSPKSTDRRPSADPFGSYPSPKQTASTDMQPPATGASTADNTASSSTGRGKVPVVAPSTTSMSPFQNLTEQCELPSGLRAEATLCRWTLKDSMDLQLALMGGRFTTGNALTLQQQSQTDTDVHRNWMLMRNISGIGKSEPLATLSGTDQGLKFRWLPGKQDLPESQRLKCCMLHLAADRHSSLLTLLQPPFHQPQLDFTKPLLAEFYFDTPILPERADVIVEMELMHFGAIHHTARFEFECAEIASAPQPVLQDIGLRVDPNFKCLMAVQMQPLAKDYSKDGFRGLRFQVALLNESDHAQSMLLKRYEDHYEQKGRASELNHGDRLAELKAEVQRCRALVNRYEGELEALSQVSASRATYGMRQDQDRRRRDLAQQKASAESQLRGKEGELSIAQRSQNGIPGHAASYLSLVRDVITHGQLQGRIKAIMPAGVARHELLLAEFKTATDTSPAPSSPSLSPRPPAKKSMGEAISSPFGKRPSP